MPKCGSPECQKEIPKDFTYCSKDCLRRHLELKKSTMGQTNNGEKSANEENVWLGQGRRKRAMEIVVNLAKELLPATYKQFACQVSYRTGLSLRKITDDYLEVLLEVGLLKINCNILTMTGDETK